MSLMYCALVFLIVALVAALIGFGGIVTGIGAGVGKVLFFIFLALYAVALIGGVIQGPGGPKGFA